MLKAVGFTDDDLAKPLIGVATTWIETMPCHRNQRDIAPVVVATGWIAPGLCRGKEVTVADAYEGIGAYAAGKITGEDLHELESVACPGAGACGGQFTANTMSTIMEFLGISPPGLNGIPALSPKKAEAAAECGRLVLDLVQRDVRPSQIVTREALENAAASAVATGGSTNAVLP